MSSLSISQIAEIAQVSRADVVRVLREGGTTSADWAIAHAIQAAGGRSAYELMLTAGRDQMVAEVWGDAAGAPAEPPAPTNPHATYDPETTVYAEETAPDAPARITPDRLARTEPQEEGATEQEKLQVRAWAGVARITRAPREVVDRLVSRWTTTSAARRGLANILRASRSREARRLREAYGIAA